MKTVYFSEKLNKHFDSEEECLKAEQAEEKKFELEKAKKEERAKAAKEVEDAFKAVEDAKKKAYDLLEEFCKKYGPFHTSYSSEDINPFRSVFDIFDNFWLGL